MAKTNSLLTSAHVPPATEPSAIEQLTVTERPAELRAAVDQQGLVLGQISSIANGQACVAFELDGTLHHMPAAACTANIVDSDLGATVCLAFVGGDIDAPIILGKIRNAVASAKLELSHPNEITLRCGKSTVQLKSDGTIAIRGTNVASRATHTNRIRGGNVQIN